MSWHTIFFRTVEPKCATCSAWASEDDFLENDSSHYVQDELLRRQKTRSERSKRKSETDDPEDLNLDESLAGGKWKEQHMQIASTRQCLRHTFEWILPSTCVFIGLGCTSRKSTNEILSLNVQISRKTRWLAMATAFTAWATWQWMVPHTATTRTGGFVQMISDGFTNQFRLFPNAIWPHVSMKFP